MASTVRNWFSLGSFKNWLSNINPLKTKALPQQEDYLTKTLGKYESYVFYLQNILIWDDPIISSFSILAVNILFWIVLNFELRFYGVIFTTLMAWMCYEAWVDHIWPEISVPSEVKSEQHTVYNPQQPSGVLSVPEISSYLSQTGKLVKRYCLRLQKLRAEQPGMFCCEVGSVCAGLSMLGRAVSGPSMAYFMIMTALTFPAVWIHVLPPNVKQTIVGTVASVRQAVHTGTLDLADLVPEETHENLQLFHLAGEPDSSDKEDSAEFAFDPDATDDPMSLRSPREDDVESWLPAKLRPSRSRPSSDSDSEEIRFRSSHFDGSSDSDEEFVRGLSFPESVPDRRAKPADKQLSAGDSVLAAASLLGNLGNLGSLLATVMTRPPPPPPPRRSSSSDLEDFEIIDPGREQLS